LASGARLVSDLETARLRRPTARHEADLARGPARLATLLGYGRQHNGVDLRLDHQCVRGRAQPRHRPPGHHGGLVVNHQNARHDHREMMARARKGW